MPRYIKWPGDQMQEVIDVFEHKWGYLSVVMSSMAVTFQLLPHSSFIQTTLIAKDGIP